MTTLPTPALAQATAIYLVNLALASLFLSAIGLLGAGLFRKHSAPLRHAILVATVVLHCFRRG